MHILHMHVCMCVCVCVCVCVLDVLLMLANPRKDTDVNSYIVRRVVRKLLI